MTLSRRSLITGLVSFVAAPATVRVSSLMPVKAYDPEICEFVTIEFDGGYAGMPPEIAELLHKRINAAYAILRRTIIANMEKQLYSSTGTDPFSGLFK